MYVLLLGRKLGQWPLLGLSLAMPGNSEKSTHKSVILNEKFIYNNQFIQRMDGNYLQPNFFTFF